MNNLLSLEGYLNGKRKRELVGVLTEVESYLSEINHLSVSFYSFLAQQKNQGLLDEMMDRLSDSESEYLLNSIGGTEFALRLAKDLVKCHL